MKAGGCANEESGEESGAGAAVCRLLQLERTVRPSWVGPAVQCSASRCSLCVSLSERDWQRVV